MKSWSSSKVKQYLKSLKHLDENFWELLRLFKQGFWKDELTIKEFAKRFNKSKNQILAEEKTVSDELEPLYAQVLAATNKMITPLQDYFARIAASKIDYDPAELSLRISKINNKINNLKQADWQQISLPFMESSSYLIKSHPLAMVIDERQFSTFTQKSKNIIAAFTQENLQLIKSIPQQYVNDLVQKSTEYLTQKAGSGSKTDYDQHIAKELRLENKNRIKTIVRDQTAKLQNVIDYALATSNEEVKPLGFVWRTMRDNRVSGKPSGLYPDARPSHFEREGKFYNMLELETKSIELPGTRVNCRCYAEWIYDADSVPKK